MLREKPGALFLGTIGLLTPFKTDRPGYGGRRPPRYYSRPLLVWLKRE
jgi:hypothetical protein